MPVFLFVFAQVHPLFRLPELQSIAKLYKIHFELIDNDVNRPYMRIAVDSEQDVITLARRSILIKSVWLYIASGRDYDELHAENVKINEVTPHNSQSFKFEVITHNFSLSKSKQRAIIDRFSYMNLTGPIDLVKPEIVFGLFEDHHYTDGLLRVYFARHVSSETSRPLISKFDVKKRTYYGNTSMEAEISLLMANQALAAPGTLIYDPFLGTGGLAYPCAHWGSFIYGSDIDGRQMRGKAKGVKSGVHKAAEQYDILPRIIDLTTFDFTHSPWRRGGLFDAIIADPPYGVRAGAKRLGRRKDKQIGETHRQRLTEHAAGGARIDSRPYIPPTHPYPLSSLARDLVLLARYLLRPSGRLVFFLPAAHDRPESLPSKEEFEPVNVNTLLCPGMALVSCTEQSFGSWGRNLVTMEKDSTDIEYERPQFEEDEGEGDDEFREKYFRGFSA